MDYVKEIERIQREQERAIREAQMRTERETRAALARAGGTPAPAAGQTRAARQERKDAPVATVDSVMNAATAAVPPGALGAAARVARMVLAVPMAVALIFVVSGVLEAWDGYYLRPGELVSAIVPLLIFAGLLRLRRRLADPVGWQPSIAAAEAGEGTQKTKNAIGRWVAIIVLLVIASAFLEDFFPLGLPVGEWLGWPAPSGA